MIRLTRTMAAPPAQSTMSKLTKLYSAALICGGIFGLLAAGWLAYANMGNGLAGLLIVLFFAVSYALSIYIGLQRWKNTPAGRKWAPVLYASQIPVIITTPLTFQWFTGAQIAPLIRVHADGGGVMSFILNAGANFELYINSNHPNPDGGIGFGLNVFAIAAMLHLVHANRSLKPTPHPGIG